MTASIPNSAVVQFVMNTLLNMKLLSATPLDKYENEVCALRVDATALAISGERVKQTIISDRLKTLQRFKQHPHNDAFVVQSRRGRNSKSTSS